MFEHLFPCMYPHHECPSSKISCQFTCDATSHPIRFEKRWVHGHSEGVYLVPFRTQKSSPSASFPLLWYESPRERKSLCPSLFTSGILSPLGRTRPDLVRGRSFLRSSGIPTPSFRTNVPTLGMITCQSIP